MTEIEREARTGFDLPTVIESAAELVDNPARPEPSEDYRQGVIDLATRICLCGDDWDDAVTVMGYAVCGVNKSSPFKEAVRRAYEEYEAALEQREHGGVAADRFIRAVREQLG